jgi:hypothetical protein
LAPFIAPGRPHWQGLGEYCHRPQKLAVLIYRMPCGELVYRDPGVTDYRQLNRTRELKSLRKHANYWASILDRSSGQILLNQVS